MGHTKLTDADLDRLRRERERLGISQKALADTLEVSNVHLCNLERGAARPSWELLSRWCSALGLSVELVIKKKRK